MKLLADKTVIITGASRGIGQSIARLFAEHGANLILCAHTPCSIDSFCHDLTISHNIQANAFYFDVSSPQEIKAFYQQVFQNHKQIDVLVNNAGILIDGLLSMVSVKQVETVFETNTYSVIYLSQYAARLMARHNSGSIINISSIIGTHGHAGQSVYAGSKAAVIGISLSLAKELADKNIRVNSIAPGVIDTDMIKNFTERQRQLLIDSIQMKRIGTPEDIAHAALFFASDLSSYVTGQGLGVDGGMIV